VIRILDLLFSLLGVLFLTPLFLMISLIIPLDSRGPVFFLQTRVGKNNRDFRLIKFRTMRKDAWKEGGLTIGAHDRRITRVGRFLRNGKLDEIPQLINVLKGDMSLVGPRPELRKYVDLYTVDQRKVLSVRPGITDWASITYFRENEILGQSENPEETYIREILPAKIELNMRFIRDPSLHHYLGIIRRTIFRPCAA
jgi:lipopolysaccharide/colanic/teichoic acid biosynthesis glycosyltransferase